MEYLAHIREDTGEKQTIKNHLEGTAFLAALFGSAFSSGQEAQFTAFLHDAGKYSAAFQRHLLEDAKSCDHSTAGAQEALRAGDLFAAFAIAGHHAGLPDGGNKIDTAQDPTLMGRRQKPVENYEEFHREISVPSTPPPPPFLKDGPPETAVFRQAFYIRMLYSCLVDADFLDTERFMSGGAVERGMQTPIETLLQRFDCFLHESGWDAPKKELSRIRWEILNHCRSLGTLKPGLFSLTVPTGGGKTGASMAFALEHAKFHGLSRIIYVIPYTSIIDQNAEVFRKMLGDECVLEHHSNTAYDPADDEVNPQAMRKRLATENWDAPVIVTTAVQFFESLFAAKSSRCRKLHNISNSILIFDEAQMLPIPYLCPCVAAITELVSHYRCSAVLCTATQPALNPIIQHYAPALTVRELCPNISELLPKFRRVTFRHEGMLPNQALARQLNQEQQVLCIVNSRKQAQTLYEQLSQEDRYHLSTLMTPEHRRAKLQEIRQRLKEGSPCRVVSTSLVEAGVDLDFPTVYRAEAGLDSILQAAGRCNREARNPPERSIVHIFRPEEGAPSLFQPCIAAADTAMRQAETPDDPEAIKTYFEVLYHRKGAGLDWKHIMTQWERGAQGVGYPFRIVAEEFRLIEQQTTAIYIPTETSTPLLEQLRQGFYSRGLFRKLGQFAVAVYPQHLRALNDGGHLEWLDQEIAILRSSELYSRETGLQLEPEAGQALFG